MFVNAVEQMQQQTRSKSGNKGGQFECDLGRSEAGIGRVSYIRIYLCHFCFR